MKTIMLVAGARPNFMKVGPLWHALQRRAGRLATVLVHTGQHFDDAMSAVFFRDLGLPRPDLHLGVGGGSHAEQTARVMVAFEAVCRERRPDLTVVVGDVDSTAACAITAAKLWIPVAHVEAGLRSRNRRMPEEINRLVTDAIADLLLTPSADADANLRREGADEARIVRVGNVMIDSLVDALPRAAGVADLASHGLEPGGYGLVTLHRPSNVDDPERLRRIVEALSASSMPLLFPVHPRTRNTLESPGDGEPPIVAGDALRLLGPAPYLEFLDLMRQARFVVTDSGGIQEETTWLGIPCLTLRPETERPVTISEGTNELVTLETLPDRLDRAVRGDWKRGRRPELWDGHAAERIVDALERFLGRAEA